ncbi:hypothetical protein [Actinoallomurus bryophytorum]|uniref:hypothetical protein n=1 Tax=Actinoallomurus bryophytorum TaxID=1490222 RepID=UPI00114FBDA5|nr:hypothetical protein [Actinoallomurus bryophytorum]
MSQSKLTERINLSHSYVCGVEQDTKPLTTAMAAAYDRKLGSDLGPLVEKTTRPYGEAGPAATGHGDFAERAGDLGQVVGVLSADDERSPRIMRLCSVTDVCGTGKKRWPYARAHIVEADFPDGCTFIDLHGFDGRTAVDPVDALYRLLIRLGVRHGDIPRRSGPLRAVPGAARRQEVPAHSRQRSSRSTRSSPRPSAARRSSRAGTRSRPRSIWITALDLYGVLHDTNAGQHVRRNLASLPPRAPV